MRIFEVVMSASVATQLRQFKRLEADVAVLGREFGGGMVVTGAVPAPEEDDGWEQLRALPEGPVGYIGSPGLLKGSLPLLPGDILLEIEHAEDPSRWKAYVNEWTGRADETAWQEIPVSVA